MRNVLLASATLLLAACHQSTIQGDYHDISTSCRSIAEEKVDASGAKDGSQASRNAELVTVFSDCMAKTGWAVATPKRAKAPTGSAKGPTGSPIATPARAEPAPVKTVPAAPAPAPANNSSTYYQSTQPVTLPAGQQPGYSIYQPAYPSPTAGTTPPAITPSPGTPQRY